MLKKIAKMIVWKVEKFSSLKQQVENISCKNVKDIFLS